MEIQLETSKVAPGIPRSVTEWSNVNVSILIVSAGKTSSAPGGAFLTLSLNMKLIMN